MATDQFTILGEGDVTLNDASAHAGCGNVRLFRMFGELHCCPPVADGEVALFELLLLAASLQFLFKLALIHVIHQIERAGAKLNTQSSLFGSAIVVLTVIVISGKTAADTNSGHR
jgi:hypothetical protein